MLTNYNQLLTKSHLNFLDNELHKKGGSLLPLDCVQNKSFNKEVQTISIYWIIER